MPNLRAVRPFTILFFEGYKNSIQRQLLPTFHLVRLYPPAVTTIIAGLLVWRAEVDGDIAELVFAIAVAIGLSTTFVDNAAVTLAASPTSRLRRAGARLAITLPPACVCWLIARAVALHSLPHTRSSLWAMLSPNMEVCLALATMVALVLAIEANAANSGFVPGITGSITALIAIPIMYRLPRGFAVLPLGHHMLRWLILLVLLVTSLCSALGDPGLPGWIKRLSLRFPI
ncbi:MAG: hypothetical protein ACSLFB_01725 [Acidimicrobiales bacterium]